MIDPMRRGSDCCGGIGNLADSDGGKGGGAAGASLGGTGGSRLGAGGAWVAKIGGSAGAGMTIVCD